MKMPVKTIQWIDGKIRIIDQTQLPEQLIYLDIDRLDVLAEAIRHLKIRGAPAIGIACAMGVALAAQIDRNDDIQTFNESLKGAIQLLRSTRPTAVNLFWALEKMEKVLRSSQDQPIGKIRERLLQKALSVYEEDRSICRQIGQNGAELLPKTCTVLTHCNAGGLATADFGTALGIIYTASEQGKKIRVYADETRPLLQGARLTAWELGEAGIEVTVLCDSAAGFLMQQGKIDCVLVGADRIASNGDTANKVGTYSLAVLAKENGVPLYVAAPVSSFDFAIATGSEIPIEERSREEITVWSDRVIVPLHAKVYNPAFDITPKDLITAIVTEKGIVRSPFKKSIRQLLASK